MTVANGDGGSPDGMCLDAGGPLWIAIWSGSQDERLGMKLMLGFGLWLDQVALELGIGGLGGRRQHVAGPR